tara:strand:- start:2034 stop:3782 length:1749 start_codon:yes stop_codon:yes gene_type:complete
MSHKSSSLNQGKFFNKKLNSYKPLEKYESDILDISDKQYPYYNARYREGFSPVDDAEKIYDKPGGEKEWIIMTGYELKFNPNGVNITQPPEDSASSGGSAGKQSIYNITGDGSIYTILKEAASDSNVYAAKIDKNSNVNKLYLYRKNASDKIPHVTNNGQKIYPSVVNKLGDDSTSAQSVHLLLRPGNGEIPEATPFSLTGNDAIMKKDGNKAKQMDKLQKEFNINKRAYKKVASEYLEEKMKQYKKRGAIKTNVLYKIKNKDTNETTYTYITPHAVVRQINFGNTTNKVKALSDAKCPEPEEVTALPSDDDNMRVGGQEIVIDNGEECGAGGYVVNKLDTRGNATDDYGWVDHTGRKFKLTGGKPGNYTLNAQNQKEYDPHLSCQAYMPAKKISSTRWSSQFGNATDMNSAAACSVAGTDDLASQMAVYNDNMVNLVGNKDKKGSMFHLATQQSGNTDEIDAIRNTIRTGGSLVPPVYPQGHEHAGKDNPEGEWPGIKKIRSGNGQDVDTGIKRPLSVVSKLLKKKKKILQQERAELNGLRTSNNIKTRQVNGMSLHYVAWVLAGLAIGGIVVKNLTKKAV